jgi:CubicO group peptidase (beta-lactamase class C family)
MKTKDIEFNADEIVGIFEVFAHNPNVKHLPFRHAFLGFCAVLSLANALGAEMRDNGPVNIDATLEATIVRAKIPGMAAVVLRGDHIIAQGVAGVRKKGATEIITIDDQFEICSCTKAMTATLAAMLIEEGKLGWNTTLAEIFGDTVTQMNPAWRSVTLRQVLAQRAGLTGNHPLLFFRSVSSAKGDLPQQRREFVTKLLSREPDIPPGTKFVYSAANYILVGAALEKITGQAWEDLMRERLFRPLGITSGGFGPPGTAGQLDQPWGHGLPRLFYVPIPGQGDTPFDPGSSNADYPLAGGPAGLVHMSITDWAKFVAFQLRGYPANPQRKVALLKPNSFARLLQPEPDEKDYVSGWFIGTRPWAKGARSGDTGRVLFQAGDNGRWNCVVWIAPEIDFAMLIACNRASMWKPVDEVAGALICFASKPPVVN